jgi:hypothetical protein
MSPEFEPAVWNVVFNREAVAGWARWVPGRFKHVRAYAYLPAQKLWIFYDVKFSGTQLFVVPAGPDAIDAIYSFIGPEGVSEIVSVRRLPQRKRLIPLGNFCTAALRHLLNLPGGALLPDGFYRDCLANGGKPFEADDGPLDELPASLPAGADSGSATTTDRGPATASADPAAA